VFGPGALAQVPDEVDALGGAAVLLIAGTAQKATADCVEALYAQAAPAALARAARALEAAGVAEPLRAAYDGRRPTSTGRRPQTRGRTDRVDGRTP
jgi:hypothetical protein